MKNISPILMLVFFCLHCFLSCKKSSFITSSDARLGISADSIKFDTVFTTTGSITKSFKIINNNEQKLLLSNVKLAGGNSSAFKINVNGLATNDATNIEIAANDSIYVFVSVFVNPTVANLPFILSDSILIKYNGNTAKVQLQAYGQNAIFINNGIINGNAVFTSSLPYVILGGLQVNRSSSLTIAAGTKIYCHADAPILIDGKLICNGTKNQPIIFSGDRLDEPYNSFPASWSGIYFRTTSKDNTLQFVQIKNAYQAIVVTNPAVNANAKLVMKQCIIDNAFNIGLLCTNSNVVAENCLLSNCGSNVSLNYGGAYSFTFCTMAAYSNNYVLHKKPIVFITDANDNNQTNSLSASFKNCIIYGDAGFVQNEIVTNKVGTNFVVDIDHCLYRANTDPSNSNITFTIKNADPLFDSIDNNKRIYDFHCTKNSNAPALNNGIITLPIITKDLDDKNRNVGIPDIGAYEKP